MKYGIQLYSVKNHMMEDVKGTLRQIAEMGYQLVEPAGFFDTPADTLITLEGGFTYTPHMDADKRDELLKGWHRAVNACRAF